MTSFFRLHPHLRHAIVHDLGWRTLRPVQEESVDAVLDGANAVVLAPTAGGKTEASMFPVLSRILSERIGAVAALYVSPIRALLNNQEQRLQRYARMVGLDVFKWHGDVSASAKEQFRREPAHILMITPESLEVMLISQRTDAAALFAELSMVVIDEVHAFAADDRGGHLVSVLERLTSFCGRDVQRIGLSATVGNPAEIGRWLQGSSERPFKLIDPVKPPAARDVSVDICLDADDAAVGIAERGRGKKSLVFVESRSQAEKVGRALKGRGVEVFIHHSSVSRADRELAERQLVAGHNTAIVCTSTMELGIDVGDLDHVMQIDAPQSVASFLQRMGRTGRREGMRSNYGFFCLTSLAMVQAVALVRLADRGWVEDVKPIAHATHLLAHQIMALSLQRAGVSRYRVSSWLAQAFPFQGLREERVQELIDTMVEREILHESGGLLALGARGEKLYGRRNFFELYAVFSAPPMMRVMKGRHEVGFVEAFFVQTFRQEGDDEPICFHLAGKAWVVEQIDWNRNMLRVRPAEAGRVPSWVGPPKMKSFALCQAMMDVLMRDGDEAATLSTSALRELAGVREDYRGLLEAGTAPLEEANGEVHWHTFAGGAINRLLGAALERMTGQRWVAGDLSLRSREAPITAARAAVRELIDQDWEALATATARGLVRGRLSKFQPCLPPDAEARLLVSRLLDVAGTVRFLSAVTVDGQRLAGSGRRLQDADVGPVALGAVLPERLAGPECHAPQNPVHLITTEDALDRALTALEQADVVGLDVETTLDFDALCLVQLASSTETWLIDPMAVGIPSRLAALFASERIVKVIHNASFERRVLGTLGVEIANVFDTLVASRRIRGREVLGGHGLDMVCERELGLRLDKSEQTSRWSSRPLSPSQLAYAAVDAEVLVPLYLRLRRRSTRRRHG